MAGHKDADAGGRGGEDIVSVVGGDGENHGVARLTADAPGPPAQEDLQTDGEHGRELGSRAGSCNRRSRREKVIDPVYRVPEDRHGRCQNESADDDGRDAFELTMPIRVFVVGRHPGLPDEDLDNDPIGHVGRGVDPVREQSGAVSQDPDRGLERRQPGIGDQGQIDGQQVPLIVVIRPAIHGFPDGARPISYRPIVPPYFPGFRYLSYQARLRSKRSLL